MGENKIVYVDDILERIKKAPMPPKGGERASQPPKGGDKKSPLWNLRLNKSSLGDLGAYNRQLKQLKRESKKYD
jgi:hypothetical protein